MFSPPTYVRGKGGKKVPCFVKELSEIIRDSIVLSAPIKLRAIGVFKPCERKDKQKDISPVAHTDVLYFSYWLHSQPLPAQLQFVFIPGCSL